MRKVHFGYRRSRDGRHKSTATGCYGAGMMRRTAKLSFRLGLLVVVLLVVKKLVDAQRRPTPLPVVPVKPVAPRPKPESQPEIVTTVEPEPKVVTTVEPEPEPIVLTVEPEPEPIVLAPEPVAETPEPVIKPAKTTKKSAKKEAPRPVRAEPLKATREAKKAQKAVRANRKAPAAVAPNAPTAALMSWVEPVGDVCPTSHPIKVKLGSRVFRRPEMPSYQNSKPDRCYASEGAARRAGFNEAQR